MKKYLVKLRIKTVCADDIEFRQCGLFLIYASNEPKSVLARDLGDCRDNHEKLAKRVSYGLREQRAKVCACTDQ